MFDNFIEFFDVFTETSYDNSLNPLANFRNMFAGQSFNNGVFRVLKDEDIDVWRGQISDTFPKFANKFEPFAFDWLGRFMALKLSEDDDESGIFIFDIALNRCILFPVDFVEFLNEELTTHANSTIDINCFFDWREENPPIAYNECVGYIDPLFDGGADDISNIHLTDIFEYWKVFTEIIKSAPYSDRLLDHYEYFFDVDYSGVKSDLDGLSNDFCVVKFPPTDQREVWVYTTLCMSCNEDFSPIELYLYSSVENDKIVDILTNIAHYHQNTSKLEATQVIEFGQPWFEGSNCDFGLLCPPYLDGPEFEECGNISCYWLLPITKQEADFRIEFGMEALEEKFGSDDFDFLDFNRNSCC